MESWILSITASAMLVAVSQVMMPSGAVKAVGKFMGGLILVLAVIQPVVSWDYEELYVVANGLADIEVESTMEMQNTLVKTIIEDEFSAYVLDKVQEEGRDFSIDFSCAVDEEGEVSIERVLVSGSLSEMEKLALEEILREDLGMSLEKLTYSDEESTWN